VVTYWYQSVIALSLGECVLQAFKIEFSGLQAKVESTPTEWLKMSHDFVLEAYWDGVP